MRHGETTLRPIAISSAVTLALAGVIAVLTLGPISGSGPAGADKVYHILAFASLAFPLPLVRPRWTVWVVLGVTAFGGAIEVIQPTFGRQAEWADLGADAIGALLGALVARQLGLWIGRVITPQDSSAPHSEPASQAIPSMQARAPRRRFGALK